MSKEEAGGCPVGGHFRFPTENGGNQDWWPKQFNLKILRKHSADANPMGVNFDYATAFARVDLEALTADVDELFAPLNSWPDTANLDKARRAKWGWTLYRAVRGSRRRLIARHATPADRCAVPPGRHARSTLVPTRAHSSAFGKPGRSQAVAHTKVGDVSASTCVAGDNLSRHLILLPSKTSTAEAGSNASSTSPARSPPTRDPMAPT